MLHHLLLNLSLLGMALLLGATAYESIVIAPNFERDIPNSMRVARQFFSRTHAGRYFRVLAPATQLLLLASVVASWSLPAVRWPALMGLAALVLTDAITYTIHFPRLAIMFREPIDQDPDRLNRATREWGRWNWVRLVLVLVAFLATVHAVVISWQIGWM